MWLSLVSPHQDISGRPENEVWSRHKTRSAVLAERLGVELFRRRQKQQLVPRNKITLIYMATKWTISLI